MFSWLTKIKNKGKYKIKPLSKNELETISAKAIAETSKFLRETRGMNLEELEKYKKEKGYKELSEKESKEYREIFQKSFEAVMKGNKI